MEKLLEYDLEDYVNVIYYCNKALEIQTHQKTYINEPFSWDSTIYDLLSISYYKLGKIKIALEYINLALKINPNDERLNKNRNFFIQELNL